jgi:membrane protein YdbS with pleckstrin-like domain/DNA-directed RNA polymerase subunit RPC12/RpoP
MPDIHFKCPHCGKHLEVDDGAAGRTVPCPQCSQNLIIPAPDREPVPPSTIPTYIPCPYCAEDVRLAAKKCKHCGEFLDEALRAESPPLPAGTPQEQQEPSPKAPDAERTLYEAHPVMFKNEPVGYILSVLLCLVGIGIIILLVWSLKCRGTTLTITNRKTVFRKGLLSKFTTEVYHSDVRNVMVNQSFLQRLFKVGTIGISSAGQSGVEIGVDGLSNPDQIRDLINKYRSAA